MKINFLSVFFRTLSIQEKYIITILHNLLKISINNYTLQYTHKYAKIRINNHHLLYAHKCTIINIKCVQRNTQNILL